VAALVFAALYLSSLHSYLLFHTLAELFSIVVASSMFILAWNARRNMDNDFLLFLGIAYLFIAGLDLLHTLAYSGMNVFARGGSNLPTQLWIAGRYFQAGALLGAPLFLTRKLRPDVALVVLAAIFSALVLTIFRWPIFPDAYIEGRGLTRFKILSEYAICAVLAAVLYLLARNRARMESRMFRLLVLSVSFTIASELAFTEYVSVFGFFNLLGHYLKILAFFFVYRAVIQMGLTSPYEVLFRSLKQREERLAESEHRYRILVELSPDAVMVAAEGRLLYANTAARRLFGGRQGQDILRRSPVELADAGSRELLASMTGGAGVRSIPVLPAEVKLLRLDGEAVEAELSAAPIAYDGRPATLMVLRDITARKRAEESLRLSEARYRAIVEDQSELICRWRPEGTLTFVNEAYCRYFGRKRDELVGTAFLPLIPEEDQPLVQAHLRGLGAAKPYGAYEHRVILPDGRIRWQHWANRVILGDAGEVVEIQSVGRDVTERRQTQQALIAARDELEERVRERTADYAKAMTALEREMEERRRADEALRESSRLLEAFFKHTFTPLVFLDREFNFVRVNEAYARACQREVSEFAGRNHFEFYPSDAREIFEEVVRTRKPFKTYARPFQFPDHPEWGISYWDWELFPLLDEQDEVEFLVFVLEDVTQRTESEARLRELNEALEERARQLQLLSEKLLQAEQEERNRIALVLHDHLQQLLVGAKLRISTLDDRVSAGELPDLAKGVEALIQQSIDVSRTLAVELCPPSLRRQGLSAALRWLADWMEQKHDLRVTVESEDDEKGGSETVNTLLYQSTRELLFNVAKHAGVSEAVVAVERRDDGCLRVSVRDDGKGFDPASAAGRGEGGSGLGLFSIRERLDLMQGRMVVDSARGKGSIIALEVPLQPPQRGAS
jgi:PAS domain S-box-containing protein